MSQVAPTLFSAYRYASSSLKALVLVALAALPVFSSAQAPDPTGSCYQELSSIDVGQGGWSDIEKGQLNFKHVFQYKEEYPYFEYVGAAMLGVASRDWFPGSIIPNFNYWHTLKGRTGSPKDRHYSVIEALYGKGNTHGISLRYSSDEEYAFLLFDYDSKDIKKSIDQGARIGSGFNDGRWGVLTLINGAMGVIEQDRSFIDLSCGHSRGYLLLKNPKLSFSAESNMATSHCAAFADFSANFGNEYLRSIFLDTERVEIAGKVHTQRKLCRRQWMPLAVTNSDHLRGILQEQLTAWGDQVHASVVAYRTAKEKEQAEQHRTRWVKVLEFPHRHRGEVRATHANDVRIEFHTLRESEITNSVYADGHLVINGIDLGKTVLATIGSVGGLFGKDEKREEIRQKFNAGDFRTTRWNFYTDSRYVYDDYRYFECENRVCSVFVRANKLKEIGWQY